MHCGTRRSRRSRAVPRCARYDALTGEYVLVLEDLRAAGCRPLAVADCQDALEAVRTLGRLHGRFAGAFDDDGRFADDDDARREIVRGPLPIMPITLALASRSRSSSETAGKRSEASDATRSRSSWRTAARPRAPPRSVSSTPSPRRARTRR